MYTITLIPGDNLWKDELIHECDDNGYVKTCSCFKNIQIEDKNEYIRLKSVINEERKEKGLINFHETSNLWLINRPTEFGYVSGSFIIPSIFPNIYELKSDLERCCQHVGVLANDISFNPIEYIPAQKPRGKKTTIREPLTHSYSNEIINEYAIWDDNAQDFLIKQDIKYELCTSNVVKKVETSNISYTSNLVMQEVGSIISYMTTSNEVSYILNDLMHTSNVVIQVIAPDMRPLTVVTTEYTVTTREIPIIVEKEIFEYEYDPLDLSLIHI